MKKLAVVQIILGLLIIGSLIYWEGELSGGYHELEGTAPDGMGITIMHTLRMNPGLIVWELLYPALGMAVLGCGIAQYSKTRSMRLAVAQITLGAVIVGSLVWFIGWAEWNYGPYTTMYEGIEVELHRPPGWETRLITWKVVSFILGLAVIVTGIVQKVKAGKNKIGG